MVSNSSLRRVVLLALLSLAVAIAGGCGSSIRETYYLKAYDPATQASNFFRITVSGTTSTSRTKFSVGFFDRSAVERLFGEDLLAREQMGTRIDVFNDAGGYNTDLEVRLAAARTQSGVAAKEELTWIAATLSEHVAAMHLRLSLEATTHGPILTKLVEAQGWITEAEGFLKAATPDILGARLRLAKAMGVVRMTKIAVDGDVIVRFLDGAGNEVDVSNQVQLIFVSTDAGRFTQALRDLVKSEKTRQELMQVVLGPKIIEAEQLKARLLASTTANTNRLTALAERNKEVQSAADGAALSRALIRAANDAAGAVTLTDAGDIRIFVEGL